MGVSTEQLIHCKLRLLHTTYNLSCVNKHFKYHLLFHQDVYCEHNFDSMKSVH